MKLYIIENTGYDCYSRYGVYLSKELAVVDLGFIIESEKASVINDETYEERWIQTGEYSWASQWRMRCKNQDWPEWDDKGFTSETIKINEIETREISLKQKVDAINAWQTRDDIHPLTCGIDSKHPVLVPFYSYGGNIGIRCEYPDCNWQQESDHPILKFIYKCIK